MKKITSKQIATAMKRYHHNIIAFIDNHRDALKEIDNLEEVFIPQNNSKPKRIFHLSNKQLLYLAGATRQKPLKRIMLDFYKQTLIEDKYEKKSIWQKIRDYVAKKK